MQSFQDLRYERKFILPNWGVTRALNLIKLNRGFFHEVYCHRWVNNIYLDTIFLKNLREHIDGQADRSKLRVRWYGYMVGDVDNPGLELKVKSGELGYKLRHRMNGFHFSSDLDLKSFKHSMKETKFSEDFLDVLTGTVPVLINRYQRRYFLSQDKSYRLTLDYGLQIIPLYGHCRSNCVYKYPASHVIIEIKYSREHDGNLGDITTMFPFRLSKFSKYVDGIYKEISYIG